MYRCLLVIMFSCVLLPNLSGQNDDTVSPAEHYQMAEKLLSREQCEDALVHINKVMAAKPNDEAYALRTMIHECNNDLNAAIADYSVLIHNHPEDAEYLFSRGVLRYRAEKFFQAIDDLKKSLEFPINETNKIFYKVERGEKGISGLSTLITMQAEVYNYIGLSFHKLAEYDSAETNFNRAIAMAKSAHFFNNRALVYEELNDTQRAIADYENALELDPYNQVAIHNLVNLYGKKGQFKKQRAILEKISADEKLPEVHVYKGVAAYRTGDYHTAVSEYDSAILRDGNNEEIYLYRGQAYEKLRDFDNAIADYEKAISLNSSYSGAYFNLGNVYYRRHKLDSAILNYDLATLYDPEYANAYMNRGIVYLMMKDPEKACKDLGIAKDKGLEEAAELYNKKCLDQ